MASLKREPVPEDRAVVYTSVGSGEKYWEIKKVSRTGSPRAENRIDLSDKKGSEYTVDGIGGALTDATLYNYSKLSDTDKTRFMEAYFGKEGAEYSLVRFPVGSVDFSTRFYSYKDTPEQDFKLAEEDVGGTIQTPRFGSWTTQGRIEVFKQMKRKSEKEILLYSSIWTAPPWMKTPYGCGENIAANNLKDCGPGKCKDPEANCMSENAPMSFKFENCDQPGPFSSGCRNPTYVFQKCDFCGGTFSFGGEEPAKCDPSCPLLGMGEGCCQGVNRVEDYKAYLLRYHESMRDKGAAVPFHILQNEPGATPSVVDVLPITPWETMTLSVPQFKKLYMELKGKIGSTLVHGETQREFAKEYFESLSSGDKEDAYGVACHWYAPGPGKGFGYLRSLRRRLGAKPLWCSEQCLGYFSPLDTSVATKPAGPAQNRDQRCGRAEIYGVDIASSFNAGATAWADWNMLLDEGGGPNHQENVCDAPVLRKSDSLFFQPMFYYMAHFSKFVSDKSKVLTDYSSSDVEYSGNRLSVSSDFAEGFVPVAFLNPGENVVVVAVNVSNTTIQYSIKDKEDAFDLEIKPHSIQTVVYNRTQPRTTPEDAGKQEVKGRFTIVLTVVASVLAVLIVVIAILKEARQT